MRLIKFLGLFFTSVVSFAQLTDNQRSDLYQKNILGNSGFESGRQRWSVTGGTLTNETSDIGTGKNSVKFDSSSAAQIMASTAVNTPRGLRLRNGVASCNIKSYDTATTYKMQVYDSTNAVVLTESTINVSIATFVRTSLNFVFPNGSDMQLRIVSVASNEPVINIDDCFLGLADGVNIGDVSQAQFVGSAIQLGAANCLPIGSPSSGGVSDYKDLGADADCASWTNTGSLTAVGASSMSQTLSNAGPGKYLVIVEFIAYTTAGGSAYYRLSDSTDTSGTCKTYSGSGGTFDSCTLVGNFEYTVAGSKTWKIQVSDDFSGDSGIANNQTGERVQWQVYRFPSATEQAYRPESKDYYGSLTYAGTTNCAWDTNSSTYANFAADTDCPTPSVSGVASAPATKIPGVTVSNLPDGKYLVLANGRAGSNSGSGIYCAYRLHDGTSGSGVNGQYIATVNDINTPISLSGVFSYSSVQSSVTFQIQGADPLSASGTCRVNNEVSATDSLEFKIIPLNTNIPAPLLVGSVTSNSTGAERIERAKINCDASSSILSQSGSWLSAIGNRSSTECSITIASGIFSSEPTCVFTVEEINTHAVAVNLTSATAGSIYGPNSDYDGNLICIGAK
jgi:hypothetical protein